MTPREALAHVLVRGWEPPEERNDLPKPDPAMLTRLVEGAAAHGDQLDEALGAALSGDLTLPRLEVLLRVILRAGAFELLMCPDVPPRVAINDYVDVAHAFYAGKEPAIVNAVLDRIARERAGAGKRYQGETETGDDSAGG